MALAEQVSATDIARDAVDRPVLARQGHDTAQTITLIVENMNCGGCMRKIEQTLASTPGVQSARTNLSAKRVTVVANPDATDADQLIGRLRSVGYRAAELVDSIGTDAARPDRDLLKCVAVAGFAAANIMLLSVSVWAGVASDMDPAVQRLFHWLSALIALPAISYAGQPFFRSAAEALKSWRLNMDVPISLAVILAAAMSLYQTIQGGEQVYFDASVTLLFFLLIGRYLDQSMRRQAQGAAQNLLALKGAWVTTVDELGATNRIPVRALAAGMRVLVAAGERVPVDGRVVSGTSDIDESLLTGETLPRTAAPGEQVFAGTICLTHPLEIETTAADDKTVIAEIARLMEAAEQARGRYVRLADRAASIYAPAVHILGLLTFVGWSLSGAGWETAITAAIAVLIITCPCALALAVPAVQVAATSRLFADGTIMKVADGLERLAEIDTVVFDKTGTLTMGEPRLGNGGEVDDEALSSAASLAVSSRHPYARAIVAAAAERGLKILPVQDVHEEPGAGLRSGHGASQTRLGSPAWCGLLEESNEDASLWLTRPGMPAVGFAMEDKLRSDAGNVVHRLEDAGLAIELLSGDRTRPVAHIAQSAGIATWHARQRPSDKIARIDALTGRGHRVLMVGDGLNDAPALAAGHASLSPASAADISQMAADTIFQGDRLSPVVELLAVARRARRMAFENFAIAGAYNAICIPLAMAGLVTPLIAAIAMSASSILVTANALRLRTMAVRLSP